MPQLNVIFGITSTPSTSEDNITTDVLEFRPLSLEECDITHALEDLFWRREKKDDLNYFEIVEAVVEGPAVSAYYRRSPTNMFSEGAWTRL